MDESELSLRELATRFADGEDYFVSEASVYRMLKAHDPIASLAFIVVKAADAFKARRRTQPAAADRLQLSQGHRLLGLFVDRDRPHAILKVPVAAFYRQRADISLVLAIRFRIEVLKSPMPCFRRVPAHGTQFLLLMRTQRDVELIERKSTARPLRFDECLFARPATKERQPLLVFRQCPQVGNFPRRKKALGNLVIRDSPADVLDVVSQFALPCDRPNRMCRSR